MKNHQNTTPLRKTLALAGLGALLACGLAACREERTDETPHQFLPDMDDSPKFKPQTETEFFTDGRAMRPAVKGAIAFGDSMRTEDISRAKYRRDVPEMWDGVDPAGKPLAEGEKAFVGKMPGAALDEFKAMRSDRGETFESDAAAMRAMINRGQERFNIYCAVCHGFKGEGGDPKNLKGGVVGQRWGAPVPSYHDPKYSDSKVKTGQDGYIFSVIRNGVPDVEGKPLKMPSYADKVTEVDAWAIVAYVRVLQKSWHEPAGSPAAGAATPTPAASQPAPSTNKPEGSK
jgi:mono/diheme cytochrome c family protein